MKPRINQTSTSQEFSAERCPQVIVKIAVQVNRVWLDETRTNMSQSTIEKELAEIVKNYNFTIPDRGLTTMKGMNLQWRDGIPDYKKADLFFFKGKSRNHAPGSLEMVVKIL